MYKEEMKMKENNKKRININLSLELHEYLLESAKEKGIPLTYEIVGILNQYREQREGLKVMKDTTVMKELLEGLANNLTVKKP
jgi:hypothetical protein